MYSSDELTVRLLYYDANTELWCVHCVKIVVATIVLCIITQINLRQACLAYSFVSEAYILLFR